MVTNSERRLEQVSRVNLERVLSHALASPEFKDMLLSNPSQVLASEHLSPEESRLLSNLHRDELEERGVNVRPYRQFLRTDGSKC